MAGKRFVSLDGLRGCAAGTVVLGHAGGLFYPGGIFEHYYLAVDVFFILSGFVIAHSYESRLQAGLSLLAFLKARARRLLPTFWIGLSVCTVCYIIFVRQAVENISPANMGSIILAMMMTFLLIPSLQNPTPNPFPSSPPTWSLFYEWLVNIAYAAFAYRLNRRSLLMVAGVAWGLTCLFVLKDHDDLRWASGAETHGFLTIAPLRATAGFAVGVAIYRSHTEKWFQRLPSVMPLTGLIGWFAIAAVPSNHAPLLVDFLLAVVGCPLLVCLMVCSDQTPPIGSTFLGAISYPLYVSHFGFIRLAHTTPVFGTNLRPSFLGASCVLLVCIGTAVLIDSIVVQQRRPATIVKTA